MTTQRNYLLSALLLAALPPQAWAEKVVEIHRVAAESPHRLIVQKDEDEQMEKVTYLGIETAPVNRTLSTQLGLPKDVGLVVINVMEKSPAAGVLKEDDVLTKLDDQILIDIRQLGVLVRAKADGEEVSLTFVRGGKEMTAKAKLAVREVAKHANAFFFQHGGPGGMPGMTWEHKLPGVAADDARDVLRMIENERGNIMSGPGVRVFTRKGKGATILDLPKSNISYSDDEGLIEIKVGDNKRNLTIKNPKGEVVFEGPINTEEERAKLPPAVTKRLEKLETDTISFEVNEDFKPEVIPLPTEPAKTKIRHSLGVEEGRPADRALRSF